jgi:GWxTD domain-containing protein
MRIFAIYAWLLSAVFATAGRLSALPTRSEGQLEFWVDGAAYASQGGKTWQELYWSFSPLQLQANDSLGQRMAFFRTAIQLSDSSGRLVLNEDWKTAAPMPDSAAAVQRSMRQLDQMSISDLTPGRHRLLFTLTDLVSGRQGSLDAEIEVPSFPQEKTAISQIELAAEIAADSIPSRFRKGGLTVRPHPSRSFGDATNNRLYYYAEVYNPEGAVAVINTAYSSSRDPTLRIIRSDSTAGSRGTAVKFGGISVDDLENGYHRFWIQALDGSGRVLATSQANFRVERNPLEILPQHRKRLEELANLEKEGGEYFSKIELIASQTELAAYAKLSPEGRREFLRQFWKRRDPDPSTPENEALREHARRYRQADVDYREQSKAGSETDRGKMFIKYGPPDEVEKRLLETNSKDVLIWKYQSGQVLIFQDRLGNGNFELVYDKKNPGRSDPKYLKVIKNLNME